jgi:hypothetical protein
MRGISNPKSFDVKQLKPFIKTLLDIEPELDQKR